MINATIISKWDKCLEISAEQDLRESAAFYKELPNKIRIICIVATVILLGGMKLAPAAYKAAFRGGLFADAVVVNYIYPFSTSSYLDIEGKKINIADKIAGVRKAQSALAATNIQDQLEDCIQKIFRNDPPKSLLENLKAISKKEIATPILSFLIYLYEKEQETALEISKHSSEVEDLPLFLSTLAIEESSLKTAQSEAEDFIRIYKPRSPEIIHLQHILKNKDLTAKDISSLKSRLALLEKKQNISASEKHKVLFQLEKKLLSYKLQQITLLSFLQRDEFEFQAALEEYGINLENSLFPKLQNSLPTNIDQAIGKALGTDQWDAFFHLPNQGRITCKELHNCPKELFERLIVVIKKASEDELKATWKDALRSAEKTASYKELFWKTAEKIKYLAPVGGVVAIFLAPLSLTTWVIVIITCAPYHLYSTYIDSQKNKAIATHEKVARLISYNQDIENPKTVQEKIIESLHQELGDSSRTQYFENKSIAELIQAIKKHGVNI